MSSVADYLGDKCIYQEGKLKPLLKERLSNI
jgi:hypothetical protein